MRGRACSSQSLSQLTEVYMPTTLYQLSRQYSRAPAPDFALVIAVILAGFVLRLAMIHFGLKLDYGIGILG